MHAIKLTLCTTSNLSFAAISSLSIHQDKTSSTNQSDMDMDTRHPEAALKEVFPEPKFFTSHKDEHISVPLEIYAWLYGFLLIVDKTAIPDPIIESFKEHLQDWEPSKVPDYDPGQWVTASRAVFCKSDRPTTNELLASLPLAHACSAGDPLLFAIVKLRQSNQAFDALRPEDRNIIQCTFYCYHETPTPPPVPTDASGQSIDKTTTYYSLPLKQVDARLAFVSKVAHIPRPTACLLCAKPKIHIKNPDHKADGPLFTDEYEKDGMPVAVRPEDNALIDASSGAVHGRFVDKYLMVAATFYGQMFCRSWTDQVMSQLPEKLFADPSKRYIIANQCSFGEVGDTYVGYTSVWEAL